MQAGVRAGIIAGAVAFCAAPSAAINVWPKIAEMLAAGAADGNRIGMALFWCAVSMLMAVCPIACDRVRNWRVALGAVILCPILASMSVGNAVDVAGKLRDDGAKPARDLIDRIAALNSRIAAAENSRSKLPQALPQITDAMLATAEEAVNSAETARAQECGVVGLYCRARVADKERALDKQATLLALKATADAGKALDDKIDALRTERQGLGAPPQDADPTAHRIAKVITLFHDLGAKPAEWVADWWPTWLGFGVELIDLLDPFILIGWLLPSPAPERRWWVGLARQLLAWGAPASAPAAAPPAAKSAAPKQAPATPAKVRKTSKSKPKDVREFGDVRQWYNSCTASRADGKVKPSDAYKAYQQWCLEQGKGYVTLTAFGLTIKGKVEHGGCGAVYNEKPNSKRGFYVGVALVTAPKLPTVNTKVGVMAPLRIGYGLRPATTIPS
jgi:hypothetical protein